MATINKWVSEGCPREVDKTYNVHSVFDWRIKHERDILEDMLELKKEIEPATELQAARIAKINEDTKKQRRQNALQAGQLMAKVDVERMVRECGSGMRAIMDAKKRKKKLVKGDLDDVLEKFESDLGRIVEEK